MSDYGAVARFVSESIPQRCKPLWLSLTGSRAFGWAGENFDYDIHGVYLCPGWFDYVHFGGRIADMPVDLNLHELDHVLYSSFFHPSFETMVNLSNPVWAIDERVYRLFEEMILSNINELFFYRWHVETQIAWLKSYFHPRTALHTYRVLLQPIYFVRFRKIKHNVFEAAKELDLDLKGMEVCREAYIRGRNLDEREQRIVWSEIDQLLEIYNAAVTPKAFAPSTNWTDAEYRAWYRKAENIIKDFKAGLAKLLQSI